MTWKGRAWVELLVVRTRLTGPVDKSEWLLEVFKFKNHLRMDLAKIKKHPG